MSVKEGYSQSSQHTNGGIGNMQQKFVMKLEVRHKYYSASSTLYHWAK